MLDGYPAIAQPRWAPWRNKQHLQAETPESFCELLAGLGEFADPVLDGSAALLTGTRPLELGRRRLSCQSQGVRVDRSPAKSRKGHRGTVETWVEGRP